MARHAVAVLLVVVLGGCGPATSTGALRKQAGWAPGASIGSRPGGPPTLAQRVLLGAAPAAAVPYDRLLDDRGRPVDGEAMAGLVQHLDQLEGLYADAARKDARAERVVEAVEFRFAYYGRLSAEQAITPGCLVAPEFLAGCRPNPAVLEAVEGSPAAKRLWMVTVEAYQARLKELAKARQLTEAGLNLLMAGVMWKDALAGASAEGSLRTSKEPTPGAPKPGAGITPAETGLEVAALVDESAGLNLEVVEAKLAEVEDSAPGPRLSADVGVLETQRPVLELPPPGVAANATLWHDYFSYFDKRLGELKGTRPAKATPKKQPLPPRTWESYRQLREDFARGIRYQRERVASLREQRSRPRKQWTILRGFEEPIIEENVGVSKGDGVFFPDALIVEKKVPSGQAPHVEAFSFKSRDFSSMSEGDVQSQMQRDKSYAVEHYGGIIDIRRSSLGLRGQKVGVSKVHLIYDIEFQPKVPPRVLKNILKNLSKDGVEVRFE